MGVGRCRHAFRGAARAGTGEFKQGGDHDSGVTVASSKGGVHPGCQPHCQWLGAARERIGPWHRMNRGVDRIEAQDNGLRYPPKAGGEGPFAGRPSCIAAWPCVGDTVGGLACAHLLFASSTQRCRESGQGPRSRCSQLYVEQRISLVCRGGGQALAYLDGPECTLALPAQQTSQARYRGLLPRYPPPGGLLRRLNHTIKCESFLLRRMVHAFPVRRVPGAVPPAG